MANSLLSELKRRNVFKVGTAYLVFAWIVIQVTSVAVPTLYLPAWINTAVFFFCIIGFPVALFFAWAFEITPEGIKKESEIDSDDSIAEHTGRKLYFVIIFLLAVALSYFIYESRFQAQSTDTTVAGDVVDEAKTSVEAGESEGSSIAVLPFINMSPDEDQEYFSDGISEEILNLLAQIPNLQVTSRSSSFFYKGAKINLSEVAEKLGVKNILEGSVRRSDNRIRITAQLIEAKTDTNLWSETYDRELEDIFAIQDEISAAIVGTLKSKLGLNVNVTNRDMSQININAHKEYLKGRYFLENRNKVDIEKAMSHFDKAIQIAPNYAQAWMGKGWANMYLIESLYGDTPTEIALRRSRLAINKALELDPALPEAHGIMGLIEQDNLEVDKAITHFKKALELNPNNADVLSWYSDILSFQSNKRVALVNKAVQLNPMSILANDNYGDLLIDYGRIDEALVVAKHMLNITDSHPFPYSILGRAQKTQGNYAEAAITYSKALANSPGSTEYEENVASTLRDIGLTEQAAIVVKDSDFAELFFWFLGDTALNIDRSRDLYPRDENDEIGLYVRAQGEARAENYNEAVKYYKQTTFLETNVERIYSYFQAGETEAAQILLEAEKSWLLPLIEAKFEYIGSQPIEVAIMEIAYLEGDIEKAIASLRQAMDKNYIVGYDYKTIPMFKKLRQHSEWPVILEESQKRAATQREIYFKLLAEN